MFRCMEASTRVILAKYSPEDAILNVLRPRKTLLQSLPHLQKHIHLWIQIAMEWNRNGWQTFNTHRHATKLHTRPMPHLGMPLHKSWAASEAVTTPCLKDSCVKMHGEDTQMQALQMTARAEMYTNIITLPPNLNTYQRKRSRRSQNASVANIGTYET